MHQAAQKVLGVLHLRGVCMRESETKEDRKKMKNTEHRKKGSEQNRSPSRQRPRLLENKKKEKEPWSCMDNHKFSSLRDLIS